LNTALPVDRFENKYEMNFHARLTFIQIFVSFHRPKHSSVLLSVLVSLLSTVQ